MSNTAMQRHNTPLPEEKRMEVARALIKTGNQRVTSELTGVNYNTITQWKRAEWWPGLIEEAKQEARSELQGRLNDITGAALDIMRDRLENGEYILNNKTGDIIRKPVSLRDANQAMNNLITRMNEIERVKMTSTAGGESTNDILKKIAGEFMKLTKRQVTDVVDVEAKDVTDALHEKREA